MPNTDEVTQLLNNQFTVLQYLEGQVEFYKVRLLLLTLINVKLMRVNCIIVLMGEVQNKSVVWNTDLAA